MYLVTFHHWLTCQVEGGESRVSRQNKLTVPVLHRLVQQRVHYLHRLYQLVEERSNMFKSESLWRTTLLLNRQWPQTNLIQSNTWFLLQKKHKVKETKSLKYTVLCMLMSKWSTDSESMSLVPPVQTVVSLCPPACHLYFEAPLHRKLGEI